MGNSNRLFRAHGMHTAELDSDSWIGGSRQPTIDDSSTFRGRCRQLDVGLNGPEHARFGRGSCVRMTHASIIQTALALAWQAVATMTRPL